MVTLRGITYRIRRAAWGPSTSTANLRRRIRCPLRSEVMQAQEILSLHCCWAILRVGSYGNQIAYALQQLYYGMYVQDDWRVREKPDDQCRPSLGL